MDRLISSRRIKISSRPAAFPAVGEGADEASAASFFFKWTFFPCRVARIGVVETEAPAHGSQPLLSPTPLQLEGNVI
jgi:hypothetical protein